MSSSDSVPHRFIPVNVNKGGRGYGGCKVNPYRVFAVDHGIELPSRVWLSMEKRADVFVPNSKGVRTYVYELVLGRSPTDRERILYNNQDPLDLRKKNLSYVSSFDPVIPPAAFLHQSNGAVSLLNGYQQAVSDSFTNYAQLRQTQKQEHGWAVSKSKLALSKEQVLALLNFYSDKYTDEEIARRTDVRLGTTMDDCACFIREDLQHPKVPSETHIRDILKGKALRLQGQDALYSKVAKLLPTYKCLLVPLPKTPMFQARCQSVKPQ
jgi:hypothetical protein